MRLISFNEKKQKLCEYWLSLIDRCETENAVIPELANALAELNNPQIDNDIFKIWLDVFLGSVVNSSTKNFIKVDITAYICDKVEWSGWLDEDKERLSMLQRFMVDLVTINRKMTPFIWRFVFKYIDLAFTQIIKDHHRDNAINKECNSPRELKNFENISYLIADYEFSNYKDFKTFIDISLIRNLDLELTASKDQYIQIKGEIKTCIQTIFERLPYYSSTSDLYYGYREKAKVRKGFFMDVNNARDFKQFKYIEFNHALDEFIINRLCDCNSALSSILKLNARIVEFISDLVYKCSETCLDDLKAGFVAYLNNYNLVHLPNYKVILTNLFVLVKRNPVLETSLVDYMLNFMVVLDSEVSSSKKTLNTKRKLDFCFRLLFAYINQKLKSNVKFHKNKDLFINYMLRCDMDDKRDQSFETEKIFNQIFDLFFNKIINLEKPGLIQYLILYAVNSDIKLVLNPDFDNLKQLFMHKNVLLLFDTKIASKVKENALYYMYSFLNAVKINEKNLYSVLYYSVQLLSKITKRIVKKLSTDHPSIKSYFDFSCLKERSKTNYLNHFNKSLFCKLLTFLAKSLSSFHEEIKTQHMIDLVNLFEKYFLRYQPQLEIFVNGNQEFYNICTKLNKIIKDPKLCELIEQSNFTVKREKNLSSLSSNGEYYMMNSPVHQKLFNDKTIIPPVFTFSAGLSSPTLHLNKLTLVNQLSEASEESPNRFKKVAINSQKFLSPSRKSLYTSTVSFHSKPSFTEQRRVEADLWDFELMLDPFKYTEAYFYQEFIADLVMPRNNEYNNKFSIQDTDHSLSFTPVLGKRNNMSIGRSAVF